MSYTAHQATSKSIVVRCAVVTFSDTRTKDSDAGGDLLARLVAEAGHHLLDRRIVRENPAEVESQVRSLLVRDDLDAILTTGGTGIARRDVCVEVIEKLFDRHLLGFGELFRMLSFQQIGPGAMLSRATAGTAGQKVIFCLPGSPAAVELGFTRLIGPELRHFIREITK